VESGTLHLLNCRLLRAPPSGMGVLIRGARRLAAGNDLRPYRPLIALSPGVHAYLRNSLVLGNAATGVGLRGGEAETIRIEAENCLWVVHRGFAWNRQQSGTVELRVARSVFATSTLFDLESVAQAGWRRIGRIAFSTAARGRCWASPGMTARRGRLAWTGGRRM